MALRMLTIDLKIKNTVILYCTVHALMYCNTVQVYKLFLEIPNMCKIAKQKCKIEKLLKILYYIP